MNSSERRELRYRRRREKNKKIDRRCELFSDVN